MTAYALESLQWGAIYFVAGALVTDMIYRSRDTMRGRRNGPRH